MLRTTQSRSSVSGHEANVLPSAGVGKKTQTQEAIRAEKVEAAEGSDIAPPGNNAPASFLRLVFVDRRRYFCEHKFWACPERAFVYRAGCRRGFAQDRG